MPALTAAQTSALRRALANLTNILPSLELLKALGEVSEYWYSVSQTLFARYTLICRLAEIALGIDAGSDQPRMGNLPTVPQTPGYVPPLTTAPGPDYTWVVSAEYPNGRWVRITPPRFTPTAPQAPPTIAGVPNRGPAGLDDPEFPEPRR